LEDGYCRSLRRAFQPKEDSIGHLCSSPSWPGSRAGPAGGNGLLLRCFLTHRVGVVQGDNIRTVLRGYRCAKFCNLRR
jgi:hypothetical protein